MIQIAIHLAYVVLHLTQFDLQNSAFQFHPLIQPLSGEIGTRAPTTTFAIRTLSLIDRELVGSWNKANDYRERIDQDQQANVVRIAAAVSAMMPSRDKATNGGPS